MNINFGLFPPTEVLRLPGKRLPGKEKALAGNGAPSRRGRWPISMRGSCGPPSP